RRSSGRALAGRGCRTRISIALAAVRAGRVAGLGSSVACRQGGRLEAATTDVCAVERGAGNTGVARGSKGSALRIGNTRISSGRGFGPGGGGHRVGRGGGAGGGGVRRFRAGRFCARRGPRGI